MSLPATVGWLERWDQAVLHRNLNVLTALLQANPVDPAQGLRHPTRVLNQLLWHDWTEGFARAIELGVPTDTSLWSDLLYMTDHSAQRSQAHTHQMAQALIAGNTPFHPSFLMRAVEKSLVIVPLLVDAAPRPLMFHHWAGETSMFHQWVGGVRHHHGFSPETTVAVAVAAAHALERAGFDPLMVHNGTGETTSIMLERNLAAPNTRDPALPLVYACWQTFLIERALPPATTTEPRARPVRL